MMLVAPRDFYYLIVIGLVAVVDRLGSSRLRAVAVWGLTALAYRLSRRKRRRIEASVSRAFGISAGEPEQRQIVRGAFAGFWEEMLCWFPRGASAAAGSAEVVGLEHLDAALRDGHGAILWESCGFGRRLLAKWILKARGVAIHQIHGSENLGGFLTDDSTGTWVRRAVIKAFFERCERRVVAEIINLPHSGSLAFTRVLRDRLADNRVLCVSGDGPAGRKHIDFEFLGGRARFASGMVSLARISGATILPLFCVPAGHGGLTVTIGPPLPIPQDADRDATLRRTLAVYVRSLEARVRRNPALYRNWHLLETVPLFPEPVAPTADPAPPPDATQADDGRQR